MSFEIPHKDDLATNSKLPGQLTENFKALEHEDHDDDTRLDQEIQDRKDADAKEKSDRITADEVEAQERKKADAQERSDRIAADNAEAGTRSGADSDLQRQIDSLNTRLTTAERNIVDLQTRTSSLEDQVKKLNEIIFGTRYINDTDDIPVDDSMTPGNDVEVNDTETVNDDEAEVRTPDHDVLADEVN